MPDKKKQVKPEKKLSAVCGLFCPACIVYIAAREPADRRERIARLLGLAPEALVCDGCRAKRRFEYCRTCKIVACARERGLEFCGSCPDYPCADLQAFQGAYPHRIELWSSLERIRDAGYENWYAEMLERFACPECGTVNSAYHLACRACGHKPGSAFAADHLPEIMDSPRFKTLMLDDADR